VSFCLIHVSLSPFTNKTDKVDVSGVSSRNVSLLFLSTFFFPLFKSHGKQ
jgi:hypothetical protein